MPDADFVEFNSKRQYGQNQYAVRYIRGSGEFPNLGKGLRFEGDDDDYHSWMIHKEDVDRYNNRFTVYKTLMALAKQEEVDELVRTIDLYGDTRLSDPSHYDYLKYFYSEVCENLGVKDAYHGSFSSNGDKMYQYRDRWEKAGVPWFHGTVCYMLMDSVYYREVRDTTDGWKDPAQWVIDNYKSGHNLFEGMIENHI